jgi:hypothetical protein
MYDKVKISNSHMVPQDIPAHYVLLGPKRSIINEYGQNYPEHHLTVLGTIE